MRSLYGKFVVITFAIMVSSALLAFLAVNTYYHQKLKVENDAKNMAIAERMSHFIQTEKTVDLEGYLQTQAAVGYKLFVVDSNKNKTLYGNEFRVHNLSDDAIARVLQGERYHGMRDFPRETFLTGYFSNELANTVGVPFTYKGEQYAMFVRPDIKLLFSEVHSLLAGMVIVMAIFSLLAMLIVAKKVIEPITKLTEATKKVGEEHFSIPLDIKRKDEIGQLAESFRRMTETLRENDRMRKEFISDVSHDFQSPLLNIRGYSELLMKEELDEEHRIGYAQVINEEADRLSSLTKQLLLLTSLDQLQHSIQRVPFRLDVQVKESIRNYRWLVNEKDMTLAMDIEEVTFSGDPSMLSNVWDNLLSNALKYTPSGGEISICIRNYVDHVEVVFEDTGIGIGEADRERIFDRFYRADESRTKETSGTGLGLAIVHQIVSIHKGKVTVESEVGKGTKFMVCLPHL